MTQPSDPENDHQSHGASPDDVPHRTPNGGPNGGASGDLPPAGHRPRWRRLRNLGLPIGGVLLLGAAGGAWWLNQFVHEKLAPLVAENLSKSLARPVNIGKLERFSLTGIRFGPSAIPATATDPDRVTLDAVEVSFDPVQILTTRDLNLDVTLVKPKLYIEQDAQGLWVTTEITQQKDNGPVKVDLKTLRFQDAEISLVPTAKPAPALAGQPPAPHPAPLKLAKAIHLIQGNGRADFLDRNQRITYSLKGQLQDQSPDAATPGGPIAVSGETHVKPLQTTLNIDAQDVAVANIDRLIKLPIDLPAGRADGKLQITILPDQPRPDVVGTATVRDVTLQIPNAPRPISQVAGNLKFHGAEIQLDKIKAQYGKLPFNATGSVDLDKGFNIAAQVAPASIANVTSTLGVTPPFAVEGEIVAALNLRGALTQPILSGTARSTRTSKLDRVAISTVTAQFEFDPQKMLVRLPNIAATPTAGGRVLGSGQVQLGTTPELAFNFQAADVPGDAIAPAYNGGNPIAITLGRINAQVQVTGPATDVQTLVRWQAPEATYAGGGEILVTPAKTILRNTTLNVAGGTVNAEAVVVAGKWQGRAIAQAIPLQHFSPDLRGQLNGTLNLKGTIDSFHPADIRAQGDVAFSEGISLIRKPLVAQVQWDGQKIAVQQATAPGFSANGAVYAKLEGEGAPALTGMDLNVRAADLSIQDLAIPAPVALAGRTDFTGRLTGSPAAPRVTGGVNLRDLTVNGVAFESQMQGQVTVAQGVNLQLAGSRDRIALQLNAQNQVTGFDLRKDLTLAGITGAGDATANCQFNPLATSESRFATATGVAQGNGVLQVTANNVPLGLVVPGKMAPLGASGVLNGTLGVNLAQQSVAGEVKVACPAITNFRANQFGGRIAFANGTATLTNTTLQRGDTTVELNGSAEVFSADPKIKGQVKVAKGKLQDLLELAQFFDLKDLGRGVNLPTYGSAADLATVPVALENVSVINRLRRLAEVKSWIAQKEEARKNALIPELRELKGDFTADVGVNGSLKSGLDLTFKLDGTDWQWGRFVAQKVVAEGSSVKGVVSLLPLRLQYEDALVAFSGQIGGDKQSGQFTMTNLPLDVLAGFFTLPLNMDGKLNATATLSGSLENPQAIGELTLADGTLNGTPVKQAQGSFTYANSRLGFGTNVLISGEEPLGVSGSLPLPVPLIGVPPANDQISLDINVKNDGLALLNLLTNNLVSWEKGEGAVKLAVSGTMEKPTATGTITIKDATIAARALPQPLTGVTGNLVFERDRLRIIDTLKGQFSQGEVVAQGVIPIFEPLKGDDKDLANPLRVDLNRIALRLKGIYQGGVGGNVQVTGTALTPVIGGEIKLSNGQVLLADAADATPTANSTDAMAPSTVLFKNLALQLGDDVHVVRQPIINFLASGNLLINGSLNELRPKGTIRLNAGQVNLFTTQFNLLHGYPQTAKFVENQGLDPILNIRLIASLPEATSGRLPSTLSGEVADNNIDSATRFGGLQTVRVQARARGLASQLFDNLELTSSPARSPAEIVALLGGGFVDTLGRGDSTLGIANLAGSAVLTNIQTVIGNALGLSEFRLFPTLTQDRSDRDVRGRSNLGLAAEAAVDITPAFSLSVLKILTSQDPAQFGVRYRLNDNFLVRSSSDFSGDSRAVIEYEARF